MTQSLAHRIDKPLTSPRTITGQAWLPPTPDHSAYINYKVCSVQWNENEKAGPLVQKSLRISRRWWQSIKLSVDPCAITQVAYPWNWHCTAPSIFSCSSPHPILSPSCRGPSGGRTWETPATPENQEAFDIKSIKAHLGSRLYQLATSLPETSVAVRFSPPPCLLGSLCQRQPSGFSGCWCKHQTRSWVLSITLLDNWRHCMPSLVSVPLPIKQLNSVSNEMFFTEHWPGRFTL